MRTLVSTERDIIWNLLNYCAGGNYNKMLCLNLFQVIAEALTGGGTGSASGGDVFGGDHNSVQRGKYDAKTPFFLSVSTLCDACSRIEVIEHVLFSFCRK